MKLKAIIFTGTLIVATVSTIIFIRFSNDHKECHTTTKQVTDAKGNSVMIKKHVCKEKFNL